MGRVTVELTGDEARLLRSLDKVIDKEKKLARTAGDVGKKSKRGAKEAEGGLRGMVKGLGAAVVGYAALTAAAGFFRDMLRDINQQAKGAAESLKKGAGARRQLVQVAGSLEEAKEIAAAVKATRKQAGVGGESARNLQFQLKSLELQKDRKLFASLFDITGDEAGPTNIARGVKILQETFGPEEAGTSRQGINKLLAGSAGSPIGAGELGQAVSVAAIEASALAGTDEETIAVVATMAKALKSASIAAERLKAFAVAAKKAGVGGKGILGAVSGFEKLVEGKTEKERGILFGSTEARSAFRLLQKQRDQIRALTLKVGLAERETGGAGDLLEQKLTLAARDPLLRALKKRRVAAQKREIKEEERLGVRKLKTQTAIDDLEEEALDAKKNPVERFAGQQGANLLETLGGGEGVVRAGRGVAEFVSQFSPIEFVAGLLSDAAEKQERAADKQNEAAGNAGLSTR